MSKSFFRYDQLSQLHIELTNACNAACPMCTRFHVNSPLVRPDLVLDQITLEQFKEWFTPEIIQKLEIILFCGVHGDPGMARDLYEICSYIAECKPDIAVRLNTNGGMRNPEFWAKMGNLFGKMRKDHWKWMITFSIDGLEDTNHIYRRNVKWDKLMANVQAYIDAGGIAEWDYLIFKHNEHQIDEAFQLSKKMGFLDFYPKKALGVDNGKNLTRMSALNREGKLEYWIDAPEKPENRNLQHPEGEIEARAWEFEKSHYEDLKSKKMTLNNYPERVKKAYDVIATDVTAELDSALISCKARTMSGGIEIFIDNFGRVMPCCYVGTHLNGVHTDAQSLQLHHAMNDYGWEPFSLRNHTLKEILDGEHLDRVFTDSWEKPTCREGKMAYCANICGSVSRVDRIYTHEKQTNPQRNWRMYPKTENETQNGLPKSFLNGNEHNE